MPSLTAFTAVLALVLCWPILSSCSSSPALIKGKITASVDGLTFLSLPAGASPELLLRLGDGGDTLRTFADRDGWFALRGVPPGTHHLAVHSPKFLYPEVELVVGGASGSDDDSVRVHYVLNKAVQLPAAPLVLRPVAVRQHYELRKPVDVWSFIKSPYGLMICFMVFGIFVFPMLKVDPEEYREAMGQLRGEQDGGGGAQQQQPARIRRD